MLPRIELKSVTVDYGRVRALNEVSLEVNTGEYVVILGPSGAGKTTLLKVLAGLVSPTSGSIYVNGEDVTRLPPEERRMAFLPQDYALFPTKNVWEHATFGPRMQQLDPKEIEVLASEILDLVNLRERSDAYPHELSGGMKQRTALARAITTNFSILLLDEPLRALDARLRLALRNELRKMSKDLGFTVLHVTHDQEEAMSIADKIVILRDGVIQQVGTQEEIYLNPKNSFVAEFVGETNVWSGKIIDKNEDIDLARYKLLYMKGNGEKPILYTVQGPQGHLFQSLEFKHFEVEDEVLLMIKTEAMRVLKDTGEPLDVQVELDDNSVEKVASPVTLEGRPNVLRGKIARKYYLGKWTNVDIRIHLGSKSSDKNSVTWVAKMPSITARRFDVGSDVLLDIDPQFVFLFKKQ